MSEATTEDQNVVEPQTQEEDKVVSRPKPSIKDPHDAIRELREENGKIRHQNKETASRLAEAEKKAQEAASKAQDIERRARERSIRTELKAHALRLEMNDPADALRYISEDQIEFDKDGDIINAADLMAELKTSKHYLFGGSTSSSTASPPSEQRSTGVREFKDFSESEKAAFYRKHGIKPPN